MLSILNLDNYSMGKSVVLSLRNVIYGECYLIIMMTVYEVIIRGFTLWSQSELVSVLWEAREYTLMFVDGIAILNILTESTLI